MLFVDWENTAVLNRAVSVTLTVKCQQKKRTGKSKREDVGQDEFTSFKSLTFKFSSQV